MTETALPEVIAGSLSPSRAADFKTCPLLYRFRTIDRLPEQPWRGGPPGPQVDSGRAKLLDQPAPERTLEAARSLVPGAWQALLTDEPELAALFDGDSDGAQLAEWLASAEGLLGNYFVLEDPRRLEPAAREQRVEFVVDGLRLRGYVDRIDISPAGDVRVVDYKTGATPREAFEAKALFQMKFYALVLWRTRGVVPRQLRLMYLADTDTLTYAPDEPELARFERNLKALWAAIERAMLTGDFRPSPSRLCEWCDHQALCPAFGGTPPPFPDATDSLTVLPEDRRRGTVTATAAAAGPPSPPG
jgi:putative RecB family exonuclease